MRKLISVATVLVISFMGLGPWISGMWLQHAYTGWLSNYHNPTMNIAVVHYQRGWFSSDVTLHDTPIFRNVLAALNLPLKWVNGVKFIRVRGIEGR